MQEHPSFDDIVSIAVQLTNAPIVLLTLTDSDKSGLIVKSNSKDISNPNRVCQLTAKLQDVTVFTDTLENTLNQDQSWINSAPPIRFFVGVPIKSPSQQTLGAICILDHHTRELSSIQLESLKALARLAMYPLEQLHNQMNFELVSSSETSDEQYTGHTLNQEDRLKHSEQFINFALDALSKQFCVLDGHGSILAINKPWLNFERTFGNAPDLFTIGQNYLALLDSGQAHNRCKAGYADKILTVMQGNNETLTFEYSCHIDSEKRWFACKIIPFLDHKPGSVIITHENISEYKRLQHRFEQAVEAAPNSIVMVNSVGNILMINRQTELTFGYLRPELLDQPIEVLLPTRFRNHHMDFRNSFFASPKSRPMGVGRELYALRKDGSEFPVEIGLGLIDDEFGFMVLCSIIDITERKQANDQLKEALNQKEVLLKEVYHRVKNNLQVVSSLINLQAQKVDNPETIYVLLQSANRVKSMALLHEKLYRSNDLTKIDFHDYIESLVEHLFFGYDVQSGRIKVNIHTENVFLDVDTAIPCGLIVNELVSNALKHAFTEEQLGIIDISFSRLHAKFILQIKDNGIGLPNDFDISNAKSLGLQLVYTLSNQLFGEITLERSNGTHFSISFNETENI